MPLTPAYPNPNQTLAAGGLEGATDEVVTPAYWNRMAAMLLSLGGTGGYIGCRAYLATPMGIPNSAFTTVPLGGESFDSDPNGAMHDTVTNNSRITLRSSGIYHIGTFVTWDVNASGYRQVVVRVNGGSHLLVDTRPPVSGVYTDMTCYTPYAFNAGDYVELVLAHNAGVSLTVYNGILSAMKA